MKKSLSMICLVLAMTILLVPATTFAEMTSVNGEAAENVENMTMESDGTEVVKNNDVLAGEEAGFDALKEEIVPLEDEKEIEGFQLTPMATKSGYCGTRLKWTLDDNGILTITGTGKMSNYEQVTNVPWYQYRGYVYQIVVEDGATSIGKNAFYQCFKAQSAVIADGVKTIGDYAFYDCEALASLTIPSSVETIGEYAFRSCKFSIVNLPTRLTDLGSGAFNNCDSLTSITMPSNIQTIKSHTFFGCEKLRSIVLPSKLVSIETYAFLSCPKLSSISFPENLETIGEGAFSGCSSLSNLVIPDKVTTIGARAFEGCTALKSVEIGASVEDIGEEAFRCNAIIRDNLISISVDVENKVYDSRNNCNAIIRTADNCLIAGCAGTIIPNSVTDIGRSAFKGVSTWTELVIPEGIETIGDYAFYNCDGLINVALPEGLISLGEEAFAQCDELKRVVISDGLEVIRNSAFYYCDALEKITIPYSMKMVGDNAFEECWNLSDVYYYGTETDWVEISIGSNNEYLTDATIHYLSPDEGSASMREDGENIIIANAPKDSRLILAKYIAGEMKEIEMITILETVYAYNTALPDLEDVEELCVFLVDVKGMPICKNIVIK